MATMVGGPKGFLVFLKGDIIFLNLPTFIIDPICRDLRAFGGTSPDHKFLVGGPKSIYTAGLVKLVKLVNFEVWLNLESG